MSEEDKLKTNNEKVTINDYYYYYLLKCENALNELEKWLEENIKISKAHDNNLGVNVASIFLDKLKELKENNK